MPPSKRMTEFVSKDYETQQLQRNAANAINSVLNAMSASQTLTAPLVVAASGSKVQFPGGALGNAGAYFAATPDPVNCGVEIHANSGVPYLDFSTVPTSDYEYRLAQDPNNSRKRIYIASSISGGGEFFVAPQLTIGGTLVNTGTSSFKSPLGPFYIGPSLSFSASGGASAGIANGFNSASFPLLMDFPGSILGISLFAAVVSGTTTLTARPILNGAATAAGVAGVVGTGSTPLSNVVARGTVPFNAGDNIRIDVSVTTACSLSMVATVWIELTP